MGKGRVRVGLFLVFVSVLIGLPMDYGQAKGAQAAPESLASYGTVTGHVYFAGSNLSARFASVQLRRVVPAKGTTGFHEGLTETGLDGSYTVAHVPPAEYYVLVSLLGYLNPFTEFSVKDLQHPSPEVSQRMAAVLQKVTVQPNSSVAVDVRLERGASLSGTVHFDDGAPFVRGSITVERRSSLGDWQPFFGFGGPVTTDGDGRWRLDGLPRGEYRVGASLVAMVPRQMKANKDTSFTIMSERYKLTYYMPGVLREHDAKTVTLTDGQQVAGLDILVPIAKLHSVSGALLDAQTGKTINRGTVELISPEDGTKLSSTTVDADTRTFTFDYVPEGEYTLACKDPREAQVEQSPETFGPVRLLAEAKETQVRPYAPGSMPLSVHGDMTGVNLAVEAQATKPQ